MKLQVVCCDPPLAEGSSAGRSTLAWCEGVRRAGHDLTAWCWHPTAPAGPLPDWCHWEPVDPGGRLRAHGRGLLHPRADTARRGWPLDPEAVAVGDDVPSFAAVAGHRRSVATLHYRALADARALRRWRAPAVQTARAERVAGRRAALVLAYSTRVGRHLARPARFVPIACPVPAAPLPPVDAPVAGLLADWSWPPNRRALGWLLDAWVEVRDAVPAARLLLAGRHLDRADVGTVAGVEVVGPVAESRELLGRVAVVAFPCPASSGPKTKVLEALAHGRPVVTTPAGAEGVMAGPGDGLVVAAASSFAEQLAKLLVGADRRGPLGAAGHRAVAAHHAPDAVAAARLDAFSSVFGGLP